MSKFRGSGKWKVEAPVRANTGSSIRGKISAPIIADDDEFPIRLPGTGIASPITEDGNEKQLQLRSSDGSAQTQQPDRAASNGEGVGDSPRASLPPFQSPHELLPPPTTQPSAVRTSMLSNPSGSSSARPQRKKSSLGSIFKKLFGGKRGKASLSPSITEKPLGGGRADQHRSDPTALNRSPKDLLPTQKRSASLTINEFNRALRSHSIMIEDFPIHGDANQQSVQAVGQTRPRRTTTPSRPWKPNTPSGFVDWTGLSPRPASSHDRGSKFISEVEADGAVGIAVTSGSHPNRRSRSLGELRGSAPLGTNPRRRSDEIRYWRESYDPGLLSPMSSNKAEAEEPIQSDPPELPQEEVPREQPQPFNFGPMGEMAGMKITQAVSLETRVHKLEELVLQMGRTISQMHSRTVREPVMFQDPPKRNSSSERSLSTRRPMTDNSEPCLPNQPRNREQQAELISRQNQKRSSSYGSSHRPSTVSTQDSQYPSFDSSSLRTLPASDEQTAVNSSQSTRRPPSTSTVIRGLSSSSPISKDARFTGEHYAVLMNMILNEQAARQNLEALVQNLLQQLQDLRSPGVKSFQTPRSGLLGNNTGDAGSELSASEQDESSDEEGRYGRDNFQTPSEERGNFADNIFGDVNGGLVKNTPRTLSLSQLTLGNAPQPGFTF